MWQNKMRKRTIDSTSAITTVAEKCSLCLKSKQIQGRQFEVLTPWTLMNACHRLYIMFTKLLRGDWGIVSNSFLSPMFSSSTVRGDICLRIIRLSTSSRACTIRFMMKNQVGFYFQYHTLIILRKLQLSYISGNCYT